MTARCHQLGEREKRLWNSCETEQRVGRSPHSHYLSAKSCNCEHGPLSDWPYQYHISHTAERRALGSQPLWSFCALMCRRSPPFCSTYDALPRLFSILYCVSHAIRTIYWYWGSAGWRLSFMVNRVWQKKSWYYDYNQHHYFALLQQFISQLQLHTLWYFCLVLNNNKLISNNSKFKITCPTIGSEKLMIRTHSEEEINSIFI